MKEPKITLVPGEPSPRTLRIVLSLAHGMLVVLLALWLLLFYTHGKPYDQTWGVVLTQIFTGRAGIGLGLQLGFSPYFMFLQAVMVDAILMLYIYPLFVRGYQHITRVPLIGGYLANMHEIALSHKARMAPYGAVGLAIFVIFPFWSTGCVVGAVVGYLIGLPTWLSLTSVTAGNIVAIAAWVYFYDWLSQRSEQAALVLLLIVFVLAIVGILWERRRRVRKRLAAQNAAANMSECGESSKSPPANDTEGVAAVSPEASSAEAPCPPAAPAE